jgi:hypothetical protein
VNSPQIPPKLRSSGRSGATARRARPALVIEIRASRRLQLLWRVWCAALAAALAAGLAAAAWIRVALVGLVGWLGHCGLLALRRPGAGLRRLSWGSDGRWQVQDAHGGLRYVRLAAVPRTFGPLLWLQLQAGGWRETVLIDAGHMEPLVLVALKARLRLDWPVSEKPKS